ncbi:MAG TPA: class II fructose-bisphosphate aldolase [Bacillales bacterium]|nr:class II fructose-bisphosphate aldolase [Bacillales bacterium]
MGTDTKPKNVLTLKDMLRAAERGCFAVGSFSPRYVPMIQPILLAGERNRSPLIVQISQKELVRYGIAPFEFANQFYRVLEEDSITVPVTLHLDHTKDFEVIADAIAAGFTSVMIDASDQPLEQNIALTREVVEYAHEKGVSVEAELGKIGTTDFVETDTDEELYTDPKEAQYFVEKTGIDALAASVGTAHGVYDVKKPKIDYDRLQKIRLLTKIPLVLHGGSGVPAEMIKHATHLPNGGISKVNIATDLEVAWLEALGLSERMTNDECRSLSEGQLAKGQTTVEKVASAKMNNYLGSAGKAWTFEKDEQEKE